MVRLKYTSRTFMIMGGCLMIAPLVLLLIVAQALNGGVSAANDMSGHFGRYEFQATLGAAILAAGAGMRLLGLCLPRKA